MAQSRLVVYSSVLVTINFAEEALLARSFDVAVDSRLRDGPARWLPIGSLRRLH